MAAGGACPREAVRVVIEAVRQVLDSARFYLYEGETPLPTVVVVVPRGARRSWVTYAIARHAEERGVDVYSVIDVVVLKESELGAVFPGQRRRMLKPLRGPEDLGC